MKAEGQRDLGIIHLVPDNLWERKKWECSILCAACFTKIPLGGFSLTHGRSHPTAVFCWSTILFNGKEWISFEKMVLFQGEGVRVEPKVNACLWGLAHPLCFLFWHLFTLSNLSMYLCLIVFSIWLNMGMENNFRPFPAILIFLLYINIYFYFLNLLEACYSDVKKLKLTVIN